MHRCVAGWCGFPCPGFALKQHLRDSEDGSLPRKKTTCCLSRRSDMLPTVTLGHSLHVNLDVCEIHSKDNFKERKPASIC